MKALGGKNFLVCTRLLKALDVFTLEISQGGIRGTILNFE